MASILNLECEMKSRAPLGQEESSSELCFENARFLMFSSLRIHAVYIAFGDKTRRTGLRDVNSEILNTTHIC